MSTGRAHGGLHPFVRFVLLGRAAHSLVKMATWKVRDVLRRLTDDGWVVVRPGPHRQLRHPSKAGTVTVAGKPSDDVPIGTLRSIFRQAGLDWSERTR